MTKVQTSKNHLEVMKDIYWVVSKSWSMKVANKASTVVSHYLLLWRRCYLHGGQQESEIQIVWEPGVNVDRIIF